MAILGASIKITTTVTVPEGSTVDATTITITDPDGVTVVIDESAINDGSDWVYIWQSDANGAAGTYSVLVTSISGINTGKESLQIEMTEY